MIPVICFIQDVNGGPIKIGYSKNVANRHRQLEKRFGRKLAVLATMPGEFAEEREIHERFSHLRFKDTEQFRPGPDLLAFIGRPLMVSPIPDLVEEMHNQDGMRLIRTSDEFAEAIRDASSLEKMSIAEFAQTYLTRTVRDHYKKTLKRLAKKVDESD